MDLALPGDGDPDVARVRARVESRLLGETTTVARIGRFAVLERVAEGGMGVVFAAYDNELDRKVAIKVLRLDRDDEIVRLRIVREAQAMAKLSHPNVAHVYEVGEHDGRTYIAMEFVRGQTLRTWIADRTRSWGEVLAIYTQAGRGLAAAHEAGLVHRDFKPDNAIVGDDGRVRVLDFGLARAEAGGPTEELEASSPAAGDDALATPLTKTGALMGTPAYMALEQLQGERVDAKSDQFAFCVALFEALYGARPFAGNTRAELLASTADGRVLDEPKGSAVPRYARAVLLRGVAPSADDRWPSMPALLAALADDPSRRRRRRLVVVAALAAVGLAAAGWAIDRERRVRACEAEGLTIAEVWNDERRVRARERIMASGKSFAADMWSRIEPQLDDYAGRWSSAARDACRMAEVDRDRSPTLAARADSCLSERREALDSTAAVLERDDESPIDDFVLLVYRLPDLAPCNDDDVLRAQPELPEDAELRERVARVGREVTHNFVLVETGRADEGLARARELAAEAEQLGWPPLEARALVALGRFQNTARQSAAESYERAANLAITAGDDGTAFDACVGMVLENSSYLDREKARTWGRLARSLLDRVPHDQPARELALALALGTLQRIGPELDPEERAELERALALAEAIYGPEHPVVASVLRPLARSVGELGDQQRALALLYRALAIEEHAFGTVNPAVVRTLVALGATQAQYGELEAATATFERVVELQTSMYGPETTAVARALHNLAGVWDARHELERGLEIHERALRIFERTQGPESHGFAMELQERGVAYTSLGRYDEAVADLERALAIKRKITKPEHPDVGVLLQALADVESNRGELVKAIALYRQADEALVLSQGPDNISSAQIAGALSDAHGRRAEFDEAIAQAERALSICARTICMPTTAPRAHLLLAKWLWESGRDRPRAVEQMRIARSKAAERPDAASPEAIAEMDAWLTAHAG